MRKEDEIVEINNSLRKNEEKTEIVLRRISDLQSEEDLYRDEVRLCVDSIDKLSEILQGAVLAKIQSDVSSSIDHLRNDVEAAFQAEHDRLKDNLQMLSHEKNSLNDRKSMLQEEGE